jgi:hypothetical protein
MEEEASNMTSMFFALSACPPAFRSVGVNGGTGSYEVAQAPIKTAIINISPSDTTGCFITTPFIFQGNNGSLTVQVKWTMLEQKRTMLASEKQAKFKGGA